LIVLIAMLSVPNLFLTIFIFFGQWQKDVSAWNVSRVTTMESMFRGASLFNRDVTAWTTSNVVNMKSAFEDGKAFNQDLSKWLVSKGTVISLFFC
jgi:hypothetical protein